MKRSEYEAKLEELNRQIEELKNVEIEEDGVWKPKFDDEYWFLVDEGLIYKDICVSAQPDNNRISIGNVFRTEEEAKHEVERRKVLTELKRFSKKIEKYKDNYCIKYDMQNKEIGVYNNYLYATAELVFATEKDAEKAIEAVGKDRVLKYYLDVEWFFK